MKCVNPLCATLCDREVLDFLVDTPGPASDPVSSMVRVAHTPWAARPTPS